jgi:hypothetical protein
LTYRERRETRADRLRNWADGRDEKASAAFGSARAIGDAIPMGQPILVGHHSERRHRRDIERIDSGMRRGVEHSEKASSMRSRADGIDSQLETSIYSDDPDAVEQLEARIAELEAERDRVKRYNASARRGSPDPSILDDQQRETLTSCIASWGDVQCKNGVFPSYHLSNLSANINRNRKRLIGVKARVERSERAEVAGGVAIEGDDYVSVTFAEKPSRDVLNELKAAGFRWSGGSWFGLRSGIPEAVKA